MPTYDYRCAKCGETFEVYQSFSEEPLKKHPECGGKVTKVMSAAGIVLKGSGFYKTDSSDSARSRSKSRSKSSSDSSSTSSSTSTSSTTSTSSDSGSSSTSSSKSDGGSKSSGSSGSSSSAA